MILKDEDILSIIETPRNTYIKEFQEKHAKLDMFFNGAEDISEWLDKIENFENDEQKKLRQKIARSTKDTLKKILNPFSKVFTANGGSESYNLKSKADSDKFKELIEELPEGVSLRKWMEIYWAEAYVTDPNGLILIETESEETARSYPAYKSIAVIHDYQTKWKALEYVVLKQGKRTVGEKEVEVYRVFDEVKDGLYYVEKGSLKEFLQGDEQTSIITHNKGFVPAVVVSDLIDKKTKGKKSFIHKIEEVLDEFLRDSSVLSIYKFFHLYPKYWQYVTKCNKCRGAGYTKNSENEQVKCTSCHGTGYNLKKDVSDGVYLPVPSKEDPVIAPDIAGFVAPPIDAWQKMVDELERLEKSMSFTLWGAHLEHEKSETATGRFIDVQPVNDSLYPISETAENKEWQIADFIARWMFDTDKPEISINYGKRFMVESPDELWEKYILAKKDKAPISTLDQHYKEYLLAQYHNDQEMYDRKLKEFYLEPFAHYQFQELKGMITPEEMRRKLYFGEWLSDDIDFSIETEKLEEQFEEFLNTKPIYNEKDPETSPNS